MSNFKSERHYGLGTDTQPEVKQWESPSRMHPGDVRTSVRFVGFVILACIAMWIVGGYFLARAMGWL